jgi:hypothetical protein
MFIFRAQKIDNKEWIEGYHVFDKFVNKHYLQIPVDDDFDDYFEVIPGTLSMSTGLKDKNGTMIFGSFEVDGKMNKGGDVVRLGGWWNASGPAGYEKPEQSVYWEKDNCGFNPFANYDSDCGVQHCSKDCKIIGKQSEAK